MGSKTAIRQLGPPAKSASSPLPRASDPVRVLDPRLCRYFDQTAEYWDQIYAGRKFINWHLAHRRELVIEAVRRISKECPLTVLDLGSGTGVLTTDLLEMGHSVVALDCSERMLRTLLNRLRARSERRFLGAAIGSAGETCFRSGAFDLIICIGVIQYQRNPKTVFREIFRLLRPGGHCIFTLPNQLSLHHLLDPWCILRSIYRLALFGRSARSGLKPSAVASDSLADDVYEKRYFQREIPALAKAESLIVRKIIGFGYGPLTVANRAVLPDRASIALSNACTKLLRLRALSGLSALANRWVVVVEKPS